MMTSSRRDIATSLFDRSLRSSDGSNRAGSVAVETGGEKRGEKREMRVVEEEGIDDGKTNK